MAGATLGVLRAQAAMAAAMAAAATAPITIPAIWPGASPPAAAGQRVALNVSAQKKKKKVRAKNRTNKRVREEIDVLLQLVIVTLRGSKVQTSSVPEGEEKQLSQNKKNESKKTRSAQLLLSLQLKGGRAKQKGPLWPAPVPRRHSEGKQPLEGQLKPTHEQPGIVSLYT